MTLKPVPIVFCAAPYRAQNDYKNCSREHRACLPPPFFFENSYRQVRRNRLGGTRRSACPGARPGQGGGPSGLRSARHRRRADAQDAWVAAPRVKGASESPVTQAGRDGVCSKTALFGRSHVQAHRNAIAHAIFTYRTPRGDRRRLATRGVLQEPLGIDILVPVRPGAVYQVDHEFTVESGCGNVHAMRPFHLHDRFRK